MQKQQPGPQVPLGVLAATIGLLSAGTAWSPAAQGQEQEPEVARGALEEVTVTGTRIRRDDFTSATPTTVVGSDYLQDLGMVNLGQAMAQVPQNVNTNNPAVGAGAFGADTNFFAGASFANLRGLNPFFGSRTLTLVDSRRHVPTNQGDSVDLNFIPSILIDRMEVVTGGASASYGSGAIGGVTNILLNRNLEGMRAEADFGQTGQGDGDDWHAGFAYGTPVGTFGHFVVGLEWQDADSVDACALSGRGWCARNVGTIQNPGGQWPDNGLPQFIIREGLHQAWSSPNGLLWLPGLNGRVPNDPDGGVVPNVQFTADGTGLTDFDPGVWGDAFFAPVAIGGDGRGIYEPSRLRTQVDRRTGYASFIGEISDNLGYFVEASMGNVRSWSPSDGLSTDYYCMGEDYAFIQPEVTGGDTTIRDFVSEQLAANPGGVFPCVAPPGALNRPGVPIKKSWREQINYGNRTTTDLTRFAFGFDGRFGDSSWTWDAYYQYGKSERVQLVQDLNFVNRWAYGFDAVIDPETGQPDCRINVDPTATTPLAVVNMFSAPGVALANPELAEGCAPINVIGVNGLTPEAFAFGWGFLRENTDVRQQMVEFVTSGDVAQGFGAGPVRGAAGASFRAESIDNIGAEELGIRRTDFAIQYGESFAGDVDVWEVFGEIDVPFHDIFAMNAAARQSRYVHTAGFGTPTPGEKHEHDITTWKLGGTIDPIPALRVRFTTSRDIRAPNFRELYYGQIFVPGSPFGFFDNPWTGNSMDPVTSSLFGGPDVLPEEADTHTIGLVITPQALNARFAFDYYEITLRDAITPANLAFNAQQCFLGDQASCDRMSGVTTPWQDPSVDHAGNPTGGQDSIPCPATCFIDVETQFHTAFNARRYDVEGLDFSFDWFRDVGPGTISTRLIGTRTFRQIVQPNPALPNTVDIAGTTGQSVTFLSDWAAAPDLTTNLIATWSAGNYRVTGQMRWVSSGKNTDNRIGPSDPGFAPEVPTSINDNRVPSYSIYTLSGSYDFQLAGGTSLQLFGVIDNLFDKDPPLLGSGAGFFATGTNVGTQPIFFDTLGRRYRVGLRMQF